jgi:hypothetical protein
MANKNKIYNMKKKVFYNTIAIMGAVFCLCLNSCKEDEEDGLVTAITVREAVYVSPIMQLSLKDNATLQLTPYIMPQTASNKNVTYSNKHPELLTVSESGLITPKGIGTDTVTIRAKDGSNVSVSYPVIIADHQVKATAINVTAAGANMVIKIGNTFNLGAAVTLAPTDTWDKTVNYKSANESIATISTAGIVTAVAEGTTVITITTADGSNISRDCNVTVQGLVIRDVDYNRSAWTVSVDPTRAISAFDATIGGDDPKYLIDNGSIPDKTAESCLSVYKPGRTGTPLASEPDIQVFFVIDMKASQDVSYFRLRHRTDNRTVALQVWKASFYGSNDGENYTLIKAGVDTKSELTGGGNLPADDPKLNVTIKLDETVKYRYIKMTYDDWNHDASMSMQIAEFNIGKTVIE